ncbi:MAG: hypothetical protein R3E83_19050 [Burkholderiaceae bacterium]
MKAEVVAVILGGVAGSGAAFLFGAFVEHKVKMRRARAGLERLVDSAIGHAKSRRVQIKRAIELLTNHNRVNPADYAMLNAAVIRELQKEAATDLRGAEHQAIEALCYTMEELDRLLSSAQQIARECEHPASHDSDPTGVDRAEMILTCPDFSDR